MDKWFSTACGQTCYPHPVDKVGTTCGLPPVAVGVTLAGLDEVVMATISDYVEHSTGNGGERERPDDAEHRGGFCISITGIFPNDAGED